MVTFCEYCKLLNNPLRLEMIRHVYEAPDQLMNVSVLADKMQKSGLELPSVSRYLRQLEGFNVLRRYRAGKFANYKLDTSQAQVDVKRLTALCLDWIKAGAPAGFMELLGVLMNPFRLQVVVATSETTGIEGLEICQRLEHQPKRLLRDLKCALDVGILTSDDSNSSAATFRYCPPKDELGKRLIEIARHVQFT